MDVTAVSAQNTMPTGGAQGAQQEAAPVSFDAVMAQMAQGTGTAQANTLSWREIEAAVQQADAQQDGATAQELMDMLLKMLLESGETDAEDPYGLLGGASTDIQSLMEKFQKQLGEESGDATQNPQIMALLGQMFGTESAQWMTQAAGESTEQTLFDLVAAQSPDSLTQMIEALPKSALQALMTTPATDTQAQFAPLLQSAAQMQVLAGTQADTGIAADVAPMQAEQTVQQATEAAVQPQQAVETVAQQAAPVQGAAGFPIVEAAQDAQAQGVQNTAAQELSAQQPAANAQQVQNADAVELPMQNMVVETSATAAQQNPETGDEADDAAMASRAAESARGTQAAADDTQNTEAFDEAVEAAGTRQTTRPEAAKPTLEDLQQQVDAGVYLRNTSFAQQVQTGTAAQAAYGTVSTQVETQVMRALQNGTDEFTMRLMPEGLGEITVKLAKQADGTLSLNIVTKGLHAQQILSEQIGGLKQALDPMNVKVETVLTEHQQSLLAQQQDAQGNNARRGWQGMRGAAYYRDEPLSDSLGEEVQQVAASMTSSRVLDTYI